jgi:peroxiredoxin
VTVTSKLWPHVRVLAALALWCSACQRTGAPPRETAASTQAAGARDDAAHTPAAPSPHDVGALAPVLTLKTLDGATIDLASLYGTKPVYLKFWATWCIPCREQMPKFKRIYDAIGDRVHVIAVNDGFNDEAAAVRAFRDQHGLRMPIVVDDGRLAAALDLQVTVQHVVIGRDARIVYRDDKDGDELDEALQKVIATPELGGATVGRRPAAVRPAFRPGDLVEAVAVKTLDGTPIPLGRTGAGRPRAVLFFSTWSEEYLETHFPERARACRRVREEVEQLAATGEVQWLGIAGGPWQTTDDVVEYRTKTNTRLPLALDADGSLFRTFGVHQVPTVALLDREGRLVRIVGPDDLDLAAAAHALAR